MAQPKDFGFGSEEQMVRDSARKLLKDAAGIETLRALVARDHKSAYESAVQPAPWDERLWRQMVELGWTALAVPDDCGGAVGHGPVGELIERAHRLSTLCC